ncbi:hypothetical protein BV898_04712 [Hypsibius exemplaris]|uniref:Uncharacterized protein n=1 Tax=Hypsibius exemplaris TaxID=2072580 RepID=A0A1W0X195_HYPEX|nr:hypothetical protein BV898_04712 [Hypsibius exemplaris]
MSAKGRYSSGKGPETVTTSSPEKRLQPFLAPLIFIGIVPRRSTTLLKSPCRNVVFPILLCLTMWLGSAFTILQIFFCHSTDPAAAHKASFLDVIGTFRRNLQIFCDAFNICLFCWKARQIPQLLERARELFGKAGPSAIEQTYSPPMVAYFVWLCLWYACILGTVFTTEYLESFRGIPDLVCFGTEFLEWDALDRAVKFLEMIITTYLTGLLCGVMLLLRDGCRVLQAEIATFLTGKGDDTKGKRDDAEGKADDTEGKGDDMKGKGDDTLQNLRRLQERVISFSEECNGVFALLHLLLMVNAVSMAFLAVQVAAIPASHEAASAAASVGLANGTAVYATVSPSREAASLFYAFFVNATGLVTTWGSIGNCVAALIVLILANLVLQSAIFFCHSTDPAAAHKASFLDVIGTFRRNLQIFCDAFNICLFCWKARQIPQLLERARELFGKAGPSAIEQTYSPPMVAYFVWLCLWYACILGTVFTTEYLESFRGIPDLCCFGTEFLEWDALDARERGRHEGEKGRREGKADDTEGKGDDMKGKGDDTLQNLRRLQERVISFSEECNGVFALLHLLLMVNAVSMAFLAVQVAAIPASHEAASAAASVGLANGTAVYATVSPSREAASLFYAFFVNATGLVTTWGSIGNCVAALIVLILANLVLQSANQSVTAELETLESMYSVGNLSLESSPVRNSA